MSKKKEIKLDEEKTNLENPCKNSKKRVAIKTQKVYCDKIFELVEGQELPKDFPESFIKSLITNKTIKEV